MSDRLPWERWLELAALMRTLWPTAALPDETIREWYERGAQRWDVDYTQAAIVHLFEESSYAPSFADLANRRRSLVESDQRSRDAARRAGDAPPTPAERAERMTKRARWAQLWAAMADDEHGAAVRAEVARLIGSPVTGFNGRAPVYDERITRWSQLQPAFGAGEADSILERLEAFVRQAEAQAHSPQPPPATLAVPHVGDAVGDVLAEWGL